MSQHDSPNGALAHAIVLRGVRDTVPYALRTYTTDMLGGNHINTRTMEDGPDALPTGTRRRIKPGVTGVHLTDDPQILAYIRALELYRVRTQSEKYEQWQVDLTMDLARTEAQRDGTLTADCHHCESTHFVTPQAIACPWCRHPYE